MWYGKWPNPCQIADFGSSNCQPWRRLKSLGIFSLACLAPCKAYAIWALTDALEGIMTPIRGCSR
ncbi:hypothetical protein BJX76DRAFT_339137 [Aspergillus varians]